ncbi:predicted response regulator receiver domain protein [Firmicutes bacterium CAG:822]|nr:predicted response regulator receiver domain protein [Firmicutes bacterium CAG:822]
MINFIICDDVKQYREMVEHIVVSYMMKNKLEYKTHVFKDYDSDFLKIVESKLSFKVYILDIETPTRSGIDIARLIRNKDVDSVLIFLTGHQELGHVVMKNDFLFLSYINKFDDCEKRLTKSLDKALQMFKIKSVIRFKDNGVVYTIPQDDILYITRDSVKRKCIIVTDYSEFHVGKNLAELEEEVNDNFVKTHRACLMNTKRILSFSKSQKEVVFDNGMTSDLISTRFDKELI